MTKPTIDEHWVKLALTPQIGPITFLELIKRFGSAKMALQANRSQLEGILNQAAQKTWLSNEAEQRCEAAIKWAEQENCHLITLQDHDYPTLLAESADPPPLLFARGRRELLRQPKIAIVGSRHATPGGQDTAKAFSQTLSESGLTVVSGLALGIDAAAHIGALPNPSSTIAVIGTGIDRVYPAKNRTLAHQLAQSGLILSELPLGTGPLPHQFPRRNRIIAGLSLACLVVEASIHSGSLTTARLALEAGRDVMAIPGSIHNPQTKGCHLLIKQGAKLIETVNEILEELLPRLSEPITPPSLLMPKSEKSSNSPHQKLLESMGFDPVDLDTLSTRLMLPADALYAQLLELELSGQVSTLAGGRFIRRS